MTFVGRGCSTAWWCCPLTAPSLADEVAWPGSAMSSSSQGGFGTARTAAVFVAGLAGRPWVGLHSNFMARSDSEK